MKPMNSKNRQSNTKRLFTLLLVLISLLFTGCTNTQQAKPGTTEESDSVGKMSLPVTTKEASEDEVSEPLSSAEQKENLDEGDANVSFSHIPYVLTNIIAFIKGLVRREYTY